MPVETIPTAETIKPMTPPPAPLARRSLARSPWLERVERFWRQDSPFLIAGAGLLVGAPVAYRAAAGAEPVSQSRPGLFGAQDSEGSLTGMAPGKPVTGLDESDPASWVMGPNAVRQGQSGGASSSFPGGAAIRAAAGAALGSAGLPSPNASAVRTAREVSRRGAATPLVHLEAPTFPGLGSGASTSASIARAANSVIGEGNGTGMVVRDLKSLGNKLAWHGSMGSAEGMRGSAERQAQTMASSAASGFTGFKSGSVSGNGAPESGTGVAHEGSKDDSRSSSGGPAAPDSKSVSSKDSGTSPSHADSQQPSMPSGGAPGGGGDDKKKQEQNAQQSAQACQLLGQSGLTKTSAPGMTSAIPDESATAQQLCTKNLKILKNQQKLHKSAKQAYQQCQAYCANMGMGGAQ